ncbi:NAD(P)/FAD-dependent oxidoreductase [Peptococcaceae bacterium]|nr:NAD(P)/FAD-dependent oxidoreductase [Peptococcaceae bacterium]
MVETMETMETMETKQNIVILGAGYGGIRAAQRLCDLIGNQDHFNIILINKHKYHLLMTKLHEYAAGTSSADDIMIPINKLLKGYNVKFITKYVDGIDIESRTVLLDQGETKIPFEYLVTALGSEAEYFNIEGLQQNSFSLSGLKSSGEIRQRLQQDLSVSIAGQSDSKELSFVIGGGGPTGVELAGELADQLIQFRKKHNIDAGKHKIIIIEGCKELLPGMADKTSQYAKRTLEQKGVEIVSGEFVNKVTPADIYLLSGNKIKYAYFIWTGGVRGNQILTKSGIKTDQRGRVLVNRYLQYAEDKKIYAVGDCALVKNPETKKPMPPTAQVALKQGDLVAGNIYADITGRKKKVFCPDFKAALVTVGRTCGLGEIESVKLKGSTALWLKKISLLKYRYEVGGFKTMFPDHKK